MTTLKKVLVVDDDPVVGKSFERVLAPKGFAVIAAASGGEALERLAGEDYDAVYADIKMPGMSGLEVARCIRTLRPWLPVMIVTGYGTDANEAEARTIGVSGFLRKPLSPEMIEDSAHALQAAAAPVPDAAAIAAQLQATSAMQTPAIPPSAARNLALFFASPFIGLAYALAMPFVGMALIAKIGLQAWRERSK